VQWGSEVGVVRGVLDGVNKDGVGMELERSVQWGSEVGVVRGVLEGVGVEEVLEEVLGAVRVPG
jgi:hypothetical protein